MNPVYTHPMRAYYRYTTARIRKDGAHAPSFLFRRRGQFGLGELGDAFHAVCANKLPRGADLCILQVGILAGSGGRIVVTAQKFALTY